jgi:hypothetical protein
VVLIVGHEGGRELQAERVRAPVRPVDVLPGPLLAEVVVLADVHEVALRVALAAALAERAEAGRLAEVLLPFRELGLELIEKEDRSDEGGIRSWRLPGNPPVASTLRKERYPWLVKLVDLP